jgi:hypothetical protein
MAIVLRTQSVQDRIEGRASLDWGEDDYAVIDETLIGRISKQRGYPDVKWSWLLQADPAPAPNQGMTDTLEEAKAALAARYEQVKREK